MEHQQGLERNSLHWFDLKRNSHRRAPRVGWRSTRNCIALATEGISRTILERQRSPILQLSGTRRRVSMYISALKAFGATGVVSVERRPIDQVPNPKMALADRHMRDSPQRLSNPDEIRCRSGDYIQSD